MNKNEIIAEIQWRINEYKENFNFWINKKNGMPNENEFKEYIANMDDIAKRKAERGEKYAYTDIFSEIKKWENETNEAQYNAFLSLVRMDCLERLLNTIKESYE